MIDIVIRAKDSTAAAWKKVQSSAAKLKSKLKSTFTGIARGARTAAMAIGAMATAIASGAAVAVRAYAAQEKAEVSLASALNAHGDNAKKLLPILKANAAAIQDETGASDESTLALMAQIRNLGVQGDALDEAAKGAIGLSKALNINSESAARYTALAMAGEFTVLQRYVPALRTATTESEKHAIVTDLMAKGYKQAQAELETTAGRLKELKGRFGDALEAIGGVVAGGDDFGDVMARISDAIKGLTDSGRLELWATNAKAAVLSLAPAFSALGGFFSGVKDRIQTTSAFLGALSGGASIDEAAQIASNIGESLKADQEKLLADIKAARAERDKEKASAIAESDALKAAADEAERAADAAEREAEARKKASEQAKELADVQKQIAEHGDEGIIAEFEKGAQAAADNMEKLGTQLERVRAGRAGERNEQRAVSAEERDAEREARLLGRQASGQRIGSSAQRFLEERRLAMQIAIEQDNKQRAEQNAKLRRETMAEKQRKEQITKLTNIERDLKTNLQAK